jgi:hypothetical protein
VHKPVTRAVDALGGEAEQGLVTTDADAAAKAEQRGNAQHVRSFASLTGGRVSTRFKKGNRMHAPFSNFCQRQLNIC